MADDSFTTLSIQSTRIKYMLRYLYLKSCRDGTTCDVICAYDQEGNEENIHNPQYRNEAVASEKNNTIMTQHRLHPKLRIG